MNPSTACARVIIDELIRCGVREAVLSPGSRNAPLSLALHAADAAGRLRLHVRIDERTAGFLALGLAKASRVPVPVVTTSGTAAVNLHPAVVEASHAGVPLLAVTADRPSEMQGTGANQTIDQNGLYGSAARLFIELPAASGVRGEVARWRVAVRQAVGAAVDGPVHVDVAFRDPLLPDGDETWIEPLDEDAPDTLRRAAPEQQTTTTPAIRGRALVVVGSCAPRIAGHAASWAAEWGLPVIAEPTSRTASALDCGPLLLDDGPVRDVEQVICVGRPTLRRAVQRLLRRPDVELILVDAGVDRIDPPRATTRLSALPEGAADDGDPGWLKPWTEAATAARMAVDAVLAEAGWPTGPFVARDLVGALPDGALLMLGSSATIRDVDLAARPRNGLRVLANRGASGIDGTVSTAVGAALAHQREASRPAYALMGDLTFLHDGTGLVLGPQEPRPGLVIVVVNDDGGGIFGLLEQGAPEYAGPFERVFGTPHGVDLAALCASTGTQHRVAADAEEFHEALIPRTGIRVVEVRTDRRAARELQERLRSEANAAIGAH